MCKAKVIFVFILGFILGWNAPKILVSLVEDEKPIHIQPSPPAPAPLDCPGLDQDEIRLRIKIL